MPWFPFGGEFSALYLAQGALTVWMLIDANRRGVEFYWFWIILIFQPLGAWAYFFLYKVKDFSGGSGWLAGLFHRRASLTELRYRAEQTPTAAHRLELGERLVETGEYDEAVPHLESVLARESDHCGALFALARAKRALGNPDQAVPLLQKVVARHPSFGDYVAWRTLVEACHEAGDPAGALTRCRELAKVAPTLQHRCLLAERLLETAESGEARRVVEQGLDEYRYVTGTGRRRDRAWVGRAKQLLRRIG